MSRFDADLIIAGGGCAGLSALSHVLRSSAGGRRIVVVDRDFEPGDDGTWAFWGTSDAPFAHLADRRWDRLHVRFPGWETTGRLRRPHGDSPVGRRTYMRVRRRDYDREVQRPADRADPVRAHVDDVLGDEANISHPGGGHRWPHMNV